MHPERLWMPTGRRMWKVTLRSYMYTQLAARRRTDTVEHRSRGRNERRQEERLPRTNTGRHYAKKSTDNRRQSSASRITLLASTELREGHILQKKKWVIWRRKGKQFLIRCVNILAIIVENASSWRRFSNTTGCEKREDSARSGELSEQKRKEDVVALNKWIVHVNGRWIHRRK